MKERIYSNNIKIFCYALLFIASMSLAGLETEHLAAFSDPVRIWGNGIERIIEQAYRNCFRTRILGSRIMNIRMPFTENNERDTLLETGLDFYKGGKGSPEDVWPVIEDILDSEDFFRFVEMLSDEKEQVIIFDMASRTWQSSRELFDLARMKAGSYSGLPHRPYVYVSGKGIEEKDVYNYLYCIGQVGMDCSGFVWHTLTYIAQQGGVDLGKELGPALGVPKDLSPAWHAGTSFFNSKSPHIMPVEDNISNLRPADIILFRGEKGAMAHSAIIQSIDFEEGVIRYLQSTDEAPLPERGVHESFIYFSPYNPEISLSDPVLNWAQQRQSPFPGEKESPFSDDGKRYRAYSEYGGGRVVRMRFISRLEFK